MTPTKHVPKVANSNTNVGLMPPPPGPVQHGAILEPELTALSVCLKNAVVKTGHLYSFYADSRRLGIRKYTPNPPQSLVASLGREVERYDQLCDSMETHVLRAIYVLQRDLSAEQQHIKDAANAAVSSRTRSKSLSKSPTTARVQLPQMSVDLPPDSVSAPPGPSQSPSILPQRRQSAISLSSLHRPTAPPKLDLSSTSMRITAEEAAMFSKGLASPVTLAPKSARPSASADMDLMAAFASASDPTVDIDLTQSSPVEMHSVLDSSIGNTVDKPIVLEDFEMSNMTALFGDTRSANDDKIVKAENMEIHLFDGFPNNEENGSNGDLFAAIGRQVQNQPHPSTGALSAPSMNTSTSSMAGFTPGNIDHDLLDFSGLQNMDQNFFGNNHDSDMNLFHNMLFGTDQGTGTSGQKREGQ